MKRQAQDRLRQFFRYRQATGIARVAGVGRVLVQGAASTGKTFLLLKLAVCWHQDAGFFFFRLRRGLRTLVLLPSVPLWTDVTSQLRAELAQAGLSSAGEEVPRFGPRQLRRGRTCGISCLRVTDGSTPGVAEEEGPQPKKARRALTRESLPSNLYAMSTPQLKSVCAAHGFAPKSVTQAEG